MVEPALTPAIMSCFKLIGAVGSSQRELPFESRAEGKLHLTPPIGPRGWVELDTIGWIPSSELGQVPNDQERISPSGSVVKG